MLQCDSRTAALDKEQLLSCPWMLAIASRSKKANLTIFSDSFYTQA
mgnify:FL=1